MFDGGWSQWHEQQIGILKCQFRGDDQSLIGYAARNDTCDLLLMGFRAKLYNLLHQTPSGQGFVIAGITGVCSVYQQFVSELIGQI